MKKESSECTILKERKDDEKEYVEGRLEYLSGKCRLLVVVFFLLRPELSLRIRRN